MSKRVSLAASKGRKYFTQRPQDPATESKIEQEVKTSTQEESKKSNAKERVQEVQSHPAKVNYVLPKSLLHRLDHVQAQLRIATDKKITKSQIVDYALGRILKECEGRPDDNPALKHFQ